MGETKQLEEIFTLNQIDTFFDDDNQLLTSLLVCYALHFGTSKDNNFTSR